MIEEVGRMIEEVVGVGKGQNNFPNPFLGVIR